MKYHLVIQPPALDEIENAYLWIKAEAPQSADHWFDGLMAKLETLKEFPERCGLAEENEYFEDEIRQLLYGRRGGVYRILFTIQGNAVHVLHVRHAARRPLDPNS